MTPLRPSAVACAVALPLCAVAAQGPGGAAPAPRAAVRPMVTDRPGNTDSPQTVPPGLVQVEMDLAAWARDTTASSRTTGLSLFATNLKLGLTDVLDLQLIGTPYRRVDVEDRATGTEATAEGWSDTTVRLKWNLSGNDAGPAALAAIPFVVLPTGDDDLGTDDLQGGVAVPFALDLGGGVGLGAWAAGAALRTPADDGHEFVFRSTVKLGAAVTPQLQAWAELFAELPAESDAVVTLDVGLVHQLHGDLALDATAFVGLNDAAPDLAVAVGFSWRF